MVKIKKESRVPKKKKGRKNRVSHGVPCPSFHLNYYREDGEWDVHSWLGIFLCLVRAEWVALSVTHGLIGRGEVASEEELL